MLISINEMKQILTVVLLFFLRRSHGRHDRVCLRENNNYFVITCLEKPRATCLSQPIGWESLVYVIYITKRNANIEVSVVLICRY